MSYRLSERRSKLVIEVGAGVTRFRVGARVAGLVMGAYGERVVANEEAWAEVPGNLDLVDAAAIPLVALTGAELVDEGVRRRAGDTVLVTGALGSVGRVAVFVAKSRGAKVWAGVRGAHKEAASALGVEGVVALDDEVDCRRLPTLDGCRERDARLIQEHGDIDASRNGAPEDGLSVWPPAVNGTRGRRQVRVRRREPRRR